MYFEWSSCCKAGVTFDENGTLYCKSCHELCPLTDLTHPAPPDGVKDECQGMSRQL